MPRGPGGWQGNKGHVRTKVRSNLLSEVNVFISSCLITGTTMSWSSSSGDHYSTPPMLTHSKWDRLISQLIWKVHYIETPMLTYSKWNWRISQLIWKVHYIETPMLTYSKWNWRISQLIWKAHYIETPMLTYSKRDWRISQLIWKAHYIETPMLTYSQWNWHISQLIKRTLDHVDWKSLYAESVKQKCFTVHHHIDIFPAGLTYFPIN